MEKIKITKELIERWLELDRAIRERARELIDIKETISCKVFNTEKIRYELECIDEDGVWFQNRFYGESTFLTLEDLYNENFAEKTQKNFEDLKREREEKERKERDERDDYIKKANKRARVMDLLKENYPDLFTELWNKA